MAVLLRIFLFCFGCCISVVTWAASEAVGPLVDAHDEGRPQIVVFWATWCGPCLQELEELEQLQAQDHLREFSVLPLNVEGDPERVKRWAAKRGFEWPVRSASPEQLGRVVKGGQIILPSLWFVDHRGHVMFERSPFDPKPVRGLIREASRRLRMLAEAMPLVQ